MSGIRLKRRNHPAERWLIKEEEEDRMERIKERERETRTEIMDDEQADRWTDR